VVVVVVVVVMVVVVVVVVVAVVVTPSSPLGDDDSKPSTVTAQFNKNTKRRALARVGALCLGRGWVEGIRGPSCTCHPAAI